VRRQRLHADRLDDALALADLLDGLADGLDGGGRRLRRAPLVLPCRQGGRRGRRLLLLLRGGRTEGLGLELLRHVEGVAGELLDRGADGVSLASQPRQGVAAGLLEGAEGR
jgi:hypothetical protein